MASIWVLHVHEMSDMCLTEALLIMQPETLNSKT